MCCSPPPHAPPPPTPPHPPHVQAELPLVHACTSAILPLLPRLWEAAEEENIMRVHILAMLENVRAAGVFSAVCRLRQPCVAVHLGSPVSLCISVVGSCGQCVVDAAVYVTSFLCACARTLRCDPTCALTCVVCIHQSTLTPSTHSPSPSSLYLPVHPLLPLSLPCGSAKSIRS
jgi:hypothetical protein